MITGIIVVLGVSSCGPIRSSWCLQEHRLPGFLGPLFMGITIVPRPLVADMAAVSGTSYLGSCHYCSFGSAASRRSSPLTIRCVDVWISRHSGVLCRESFVDLWMSYWLELRREIQRKHDADVALHFLFLCFIYPIFNYSNIFYNLF